MLSNKGLIIEDQLLRNKLRAHYDKFISNLTIKTPQMVGKDKIVKLYKYYGKTTKYIILPRHYIDIINKYNITQVVNLLPQPKLKHYDLSIQLFSNQITIIDYLMDNIYTTKNRDVGIAATTLNFGAGLGKTFVAAGLIDQLSTNTLFVSPTKFLQSQAFEDLSKAFPKSYILKYEGQTDYDKLFKCDIAIIIINTLMNISAETHKTKAICDYFGFIIYDEIHKYCSEKRADVFWNYNTSYCLGISATTDERLDKFDVVYFKHVGKVIHAKDIPNYSDDGVKFDCTVNAIKYRGPPEYTANIYSEATNMLFIPGMIKQLIEDPFRLDLIIDQIMLLYEKGKNIYLFSEYTEYIDKIRDRLLAVSEALAPVLFILKGGTKEAEMKETINNARIILTTYGYSGTGISIVRMDAAIFATPRVNGYKQICARIMRRGSDQAIPRLFVDIIDHNTKLKNQFYKRRKTYTFYGFKVIESDYHYKN